MSSVSVRPARADHGSVRVHDAAGRLLRFPKSYRAEVGRLAARDSRLADLALSFPALLFALAVPRRGFNPDLAVEAVVAGRRLKEVAHMAGVPLWLRRMPPETFEARLAPLPDGAAVRLQIANILPPRRHAAVWLRLVTQAFDLAGTDYALWLAREIRRRPAAFRPVPRGWARNPPGIHALRRLALWAWYSRRPDTMAGALIDHRWSDAIGFEAALAACEDWWDDLGVHIHLGPGRLSPSWLEPGCEGGYDFLPVDTAERFITQAKQQHNCVRARVLWVSDQFERLWQVAKDGKTVGTLSIGVSGSEGICQILSLAGHRNRRLPGDVWIAAERWLRRAEPIYLEGGGRPSIDPATWTRMWRPYWVAGGRIPAWLPLRGSSDAFDAI